MERMGVEYQRFDGKEYVSLRRYYNLLCKCETLEQENKNLKETNMDLNSALMVSSAEIVRLKEELKELKEKLNKAGLEEYGFFNEY